MTLFAAAIFPRRSRLPFAPAAGRSSADSANPREHRAAAVPQRVTCEWEYCDLNPARNLLRCIRPRMYARVCGSYSLHVLLHVEISLRLDFATSVAVMGPQCQKLGKFTVRFPWQRCSWGCWQKGATQFQCMPPACKTQHRIDAEEVACLFVRESCTPVCFFPRTGKDQDTIRKDLMRDNFMSAEEAAWRQYMWTLI